ncbi:MULTISPECIES: asparagine synthase (glutamine-hydrolyzing) [Enterobacter cloacae complex]|nr:MULTISPECIES: asparagine synthase (glutamine-hydrolyzing) [Enterobacter cloacae complex]CAH8249939.1 Asparagine synthetase [glutamine-hydrolyzing] 3 [Enterobacter ludwigii]
MCGFVVTVKKKNVFDNSNFSLSLNSLNHRGPDGSGVESFRDGRVKLGHVRLKIVGKDNGSQPITDENVMLSTVINGEFYNYKEQKEALKKRGHMFMTDSDSEIVIPLYKENNKAFLNHLDGEFSGVIWDEEKGMLTAFRDRHGIKPLFYAQNEEYIVFASEAKAILEFLKEHPTWNNDYVLQSLLLINQQDNTIFNGVKQLRPGSYLTYDISSHELKENVFWSTNYDKKKYSNLSFEGVVNKYESLFVRSVAKRIFAEVPVAVYLSGGIDSAACYGVSCSLAGKGLDAFTISFDNPAYDEFYAAEKMVEKYDGKHHVINIKEQDLVDNFEKHVWHTEMPCINPHSVAKYILSKKVKENGFKVVITGEGSDEYNGGYPVSIIDAERAGFKTSYINKNNVNFGSVLNEKTSESYYARSIFGFSPCFYENAEKSLTEFSDFYRRNNDLSFSLNDIMASRYDRKMALWDKMNISLFLTAQSSLSYVLSVLGDRVEMANGVEGRLPFLDNDIIDFMETVPVQFKFKNNVDKPILRASMVKYVTPDIIKSQKHPFVAPPLIKKDSPFFIYMNDIFSSCGYLSGGIFDRRKVLNQLHDLAKSELKKPEIEKRLFFILSMSTIHDKFGFRSNDFS